MREGGGWWVLVGMELFGWFGEFGWIGDDFER